MKYIVKYRHGKNDPFKNVMEEYVPTRGRFKGMRASRDRIFESYDDAEIVRKKYALHYGEENTKIAERKA